MKTLKLMTVLACVAMLGMSANALAQAPTCDDVVWNETVLAATPTMAQHCLDMVQRGGEEWYAKMTARVVRQGVSSTVVRWKNRDGSWSASDRVYPPRGFTAEVGGEDVRIADLSPNQEVNVYVRSQGNYTIPSMAAAAPAPAAAPVEEPAPAPEPAAEPDPEPEEAYEEPAPAALPSTAGQANWLAVLGALMLLAAATIHILRNRN